MTMTAPSPNSAMLTKAEVGIPGGVAGLDGDGTLTLDQTPERLLTTNDERPVGKGELRLNVLDFGADPTGVRDSTEAFNAAMGIPGAHVYVPPGTYLITSHFTRPARAIALKTAVLIAPNVTVECGPNVVIRLGDLSRVTGFRNDTVGDQGNITWIGGLYDGNDANQGDEAADGNAFDLAKGFWFTNQNTGTLRLIDLEVRHTRGHAINHWNWDYLFVRGFKLMQRKNPISPAGGRRRDGITGMSRHVDIEGVSGHSGDDLIAVLAGAEWGSGPGPIPVETVNIRGVSAQVCDTDKEIKTWRGVTLYNMNSYQFGSIVISNVTGETKSGHIRFRTYADPGDSGPNINRGFVKSAVIMTVSGSSQSFVGNETFISISQTTIDQLVIVGVARTAYAKSYGGTTTIPITPTILVEDAWIKTLILDGISSVQEDTGAGRNVDLVSIIGSSRVDRIFGSSLSLTQPNASPAGTLTLLRKDVTNTTPTNVSGFLGRDVAAVGTSVVNGLLSPGNGADANTLTDPGRYATFAAAANWPDTAGGTTQSMLVERPTAATIIQTVTRDRLDQLKSMTRRSADGGVTWSAWQGFNLLTNTKWLEGIDASPGFFSPGLLANVLRRSWGTRPTDSTAQPGVFGKNTITGKMERLLSRTTVNNVTTFVWEDFNGVETARITSP